MKFTPGPWEHNATNTAPACAVWSADGEKFICCTKWEKDGFRRGPSDEEAHHNARAIAALPYALECLRELVAELDLNETRTPGWHKARALLNHLED